MSATIRVRNADGVRDKIGWLDVEARTVCPPFAIHGDRALGWTLIHLPTGYQVFHFETLKDARAVLADLAERPVLWAFRTVGPKTKPQRREARAALVESLDRHGISLPFSRNSSTEAAS
jgi:hypothetical protein